MTSVLPADEYEKLVHSLITELAQANGVSTDRLERPSERLPGLTGTTHQIDVLWDFADTDGLKWRVLFEARSYKSNLKQSAVFAFDGVVRDIGAISDRQCVGVIVTSTGYQAGAKLVGDSHGVLLLEARSPTSRDFEGRIERIYMTADVRLPFIENVQVQLYDGVTGDSRRTVVGLERPDGTRVTIDKVLLAGELAPRDQPPTVRHRVECRFERGTYLVCDGERVGEVEILVAEVGENELRHTISVGGRERLAWLLADATGADRVWFAKDGRHWTTN